MRKLLISGLATAFAVATSATMLMGAATTPAHGSQGLFSIAAQPALADDDNNQGDGGHGRGHGRRDENNQGDNNQGDEDNQGDHGGKGCYNPAGHQRGWCKHNRGGRGGNRSTVRGIVENSNGNGSYQFREDNGQVITVLDPNQNLYVGQHYDLQGCFNNGTFDVNCNGDYNNGGNGGYNNGGGNYQSSLSGYITTISGGTVTINQNLIGGTVSFDASQAINSGNTNGSLHFGRHITAYGYYDSNHYFHAQYIR